MATLAAILSTEPNLPGTLPNPETRLRFQLTSDRSGRSFAPVACQHDYPKRRIECLVG